VAATLDGGVGGVDHGGESAGEFAGEELHGLVGGHPEPGTLVAERGERDRAYAPTELHLVADGVGTAVVEQDLLGSGNTDHGDESRGGVESRGGSEGRVCITAVDSQRNGTEEEEEECQERGEGRRSGGGYCDGKHCASGHLLADSAIDQGWRQAYLGEEDLGIGRSVCIITLMVECQRLWTVQLT